MTRPSPVRRASWCVGLLLLLGLASPAPAGPPALEAGFAVVDLTPEGRVPLGGYGARLGAPSRGVHDPIEARAVVFRQGARSVALVAVDLVGVERRLTDGLRRRLADLALGDVVLAATHTHAGPGALTRVPVWRPAMGRFDAALWARTAARIEGAVRAAHADLAPVRARYIRTDPARLRGRVRTRAEVGVPPDASLGVVRIDRPDGTPRGVLVHFGAHATLLGAPVRELSAGWPGALRRHLEARLPGATAIFVQGTLGDVSPVAPEGAPPDAWGRMEAYGRALADVAADACLRLPERTEAATPTLEVLGTRDLLAPTAAGALLGGSPGPALLGSWHFPVARVRLGPLELVTLPGEPVTAFGRRIGAGPDRWIVACAQDHLGYFPDRAMFRAARDYEAELAFFGPGLAARVSGLVDPAPGAGGGNEGVARRAPLAPGVYGIRASPGVGGSAWTLGHDHGSQLDARIRDLLKAAESHLEDQVLAHGGGLLLAPATLATGLDARDVVIPLLVRAARRLQRHVPASYLDEMEGVAAGAGVPYDAVLLENVFLTLAEQRDKTALLTLPARCTNLVATGPATSMGQLLHGSTLDWGMRDVLKERVVTLVVEPAEGHPFASITWPGMVGTLRAMGAQGIAVTEESCAAPDDTTLDGIPVGLLLRDVVQHASSLDDAVRRLTEAPGTCGYKITVSDGRSLDARVVEVTAHRHHVRGLRDGLLFGCDPNAPCLGDCDPVIPRQDGSSARRYPVVRRLLEGAAPAARLADVEGALGTREGGVLNDGTLLACIFEPQLGRFHVAQGEDVRPAAGRLSFRSYELPALLRPRNRERYTPPWPVSDVGDVETRVKIEDFGGTRIEEGWFDSPVRSGFPGNDRFKVEIYTPKDPVGVVIQLPHWKDPSGAQGQKLVALALARRGIASVLLPLPWQYGRTPPGLRSGERTLSQDLARTREAAFQGVADAVRVGLWLERERGFPPSRQALLGLSLGGHIASLAYGAHPERFAGATILLAGSHREGAIFRENGVTDGILRRLRARGVTFEEAFELLAPIDPAALARPELAAHVLLVAGTEDPVAPPESVEALARAWGGARIATFDGDHYSIVRHWATILREIGDHFLASFPSDQPSSRER